MCVCCWCGYGFSVFFFFKQKTAYEMRISDWSSDVCSSDLDVDVAGDDQRRSAAGDRPVEVDEFRRDEAVVAGPRLRGGGLDQASRPRHLADADRGEQQSVVGCYDVPRQAVSASTGQSPAVAFVATRSESYLMHVQVPGSP